MKKKYRSDFADENYLDNSDEYSYHNKKGQHVEVKHVRVHKYSQQLQYDKGDYISINFASLYDLDIRQEIIEELISSLQLMLEKYQIAEKDPILIVGLGNHSITADKLGPQVISKVIVTNHLKKYDQELFEQTRPITAFSPRVMGQTGLESSDIIKSILKLAKPKMIIVIDALATRSLTRLNKAIQVSDTGINPGSGIGNHRKALSFKTLKVPVIAIGVATVVSLDNLFNQLIISATKAVKESQNFQIIERFADQLRQKSEVDLIVTPKEIDDDMEHLVNIISESLNHALINNIEQL